MVVRMSEHSVTISWQRQGAAFIDKKYSRVHQWQFDGGATVLGSPSPHVVRLPYSDPAGVDPEEAFVASISACHMLWFLDLAAGQKLVVERYEDHAVGTLARNAQRKSAITRVVLRPLIAFADPVPSAEQIAALHHESHDKCFIANSVLTEILVEPR